MTRTQIQLPDDLYRRAKEFAESREMSLAEVVRRGLEQFFAAYPPPEETEREWKMPSSSRLGCRPLSPAQLRDAARGESELPEWLSSKAKRS